MNLLPFLMIPSFFTLSRAPIPHAHNEETWKKAAAFLKYGMNPKAEPCEEFFEHACGDFPRDNNTEYPNEYGMAYHLQQTTVDKTLRAAIENIDLTLPEILPYKKSVKIFLDQCVSVKNNSQWQQDLYKAIASRIGPLGGSGAKNNESNGTKAQETWRLAGSVIQEFGQPVFALWQPVQVDATVKDVYETQVNVKLNFAAGCNYSEHFFRSLYQKISPQMLETNDTIEKWIADVSTLCSDLNNVLKSFLGGEQNFTLVNSTHFSALALNFDWKAFLEGQIPVGYHHIISNPTRFQAYVKSLIILDRMGLVFQKHDTETVHALAFLTVFAKTPLPNAKKDCVRYSQLHFGPALARIYFDHIGEDISQWRDEIVLLKRNLNAAFTFVLNSAEWLDAEDKEKLQRKMANVQFYPGLPDWIENNTEILNRIPEYKSDVNIFENYFSGAKVLSKKLFKRLDVANRDIFEGVHILFEVQAYYNEDFRIINNQLGIGLPPYFDIDYPIAVKYGLLGFALAHEIMHGFDSERVAVVRHESKRIKPQAVQEYKKQQECLSQQFNSYCNQNQDLCISGKFTLAENVADSAGIKIAYIAYKVLTQLMPVDPPMVGMLNYTYDQIFFITAAKFFCNQDRNIDVTDPHASMRARVELGFRNVPVFARAFKCKAGSKYAPLLPCSVWADIANPAAL